MDFTWYLYPGQTLENTTPEQRGKALIATPSAWKNIINRTGQKQIKQEFLAKENARDKYLREGSKAITENWEDTIEKTRERQLNLLKNPNERRDALHYKQYIKLREDQEQERDALVNEAKAKMYMSTQEPRTLTSALLFTETMFERDMQKQLQQYENEHEKIEIMKEAKLIKENAAMEIIENMEKQKKRKELDKKNHEELLEQILENQAIANKIQEERLISEKAANRIAEKEFKEIQEYERQSIQTGKEKFKKQLEESQKMQRKCKAQLKLQDENEDKIISIYSRAKCRIEEKQKQSIKEMQNKMIALRGRVAANLTEINTDHGDDERRLKNAQIEIEQKQQQQIEEKEEHRQKLIHEKLDYITEIKEKKIKEKEMDKEVKKWEMLNKVKTNEIMLKYEQEKAQKIFDEKIKYRRILQKQVAEKDKDYEKVCAEQVLKYYKEKHEAEDKAYFNYADNVLDLAKSRGRDIKPIEKTIEQYKLENQLLPKKKNLTNLQSKVPINNNKKQL